MLLFCLPYAGGSERIYYNWREYLKPQIEIKPIELRGRGKRFNEPFYENINEAVEDIYSIIEKLIQDEDYAIYGHSMGSTIAYELYYKIEKMNKRKPIHMFFSGNKAPGIKIKSNITHTLPDEEFMQKVVALGGTPKEVLNNKELMQLFLPILKNDFKIVERYNYKEKENKMECSISILNGYKDDLKDEEILRWRDHTSKEFKVYYFEGNHFFINNNVKCITDILNYTLLGGNNKLNHKC